MLDVEQVRRVGQDYAFRLRQPREQHLMALAPDRRELLALRADDGQGGLGDAASILSLQRPLLQRRELLAKERIRIGDSLLECTGKHSVEDRTVACSGDAAHEAIDGASPVAGAI